MYDHFVISVHVIVKNYHLRLVHLCRGMCKQSLRRDNLFGTVQKMNVNVIIHFTDCI